MTRLVVVDPDTGERFPLELDHVNVRIGSAEDCDICIEGLQPLHCEVRPSGAGGYTLLPRGQVLVNGEPIRRPYGLEDGDIVTVGPTDIRFEGERRAPSSVPAEKRAPAPKGVSASPASGPAREFRMKVRDYLIQHPEMKKLARAPNDEKLVKNLRSLIKEAIGAVGVAKPGCLTEEAIIKEFLDDILGLGPLEDLMRDDTINEIMVNRFDTILVERTDGRMERVDVSFYDENHLIETIRRIIAPLGRHLNESNPMVDARLKDGTRINAAMSPVAVSGACMTIRKFRRRTLTLNDLVQMKSLTPPAAAFLKLCVQQRLNILISGGTGSGKTTLLNALGMLIAPSERIVVIEDTHELRIEHENLVYLEAKPPNIEGQGEITIRRLVINALRMRPDRIVVGECRGGEAFDMLQAMNTGHLGSMTTIHANTERDAFSRLENMVLMAGFEIPISAIRKQIASAIHIIVHIARNAAGRQVIKIAEVTGCDGNTISLQDLFVRDADTGELRTTGIVPKFFSSLPQARRQDLIQRLGFNRKVHA